MHLRVPRWRSLPVRSFILRAALTWLPLVPLLGASLVTVQATDAQIRIVEPEADGFETVLEYGKNLEQQHKWTEALTHYEQAVKQFPNDPQLRGRHDLARIHYDLTRRYSDASYRNSVKTLSRQAAIELYDEVLLKLDAHYVKRPSWQKLVDRGTRCVEIALHEDIFIKQNLQSVPSERISAAKNRLRNFVDSRAVQNRSDARAIVAAAAQLMAHDLGIPRSAVVLEYVAGASGGLDTYSTFLTSDQLKDVYSQIDGNFVGLGIEVKASDGSLFIVSVITGSPAAQAGIRGGDRITSVDGKLTKNLATDEAAVLLQGPENSYVELGIESPNRVPKLMRLMRQHIDVPSVDDIKLVDEANGIGYLRLVSFQRSTSRDMDAALWKLYHMGMKSLIIDVRGNPGGLLTAAVDVADKFVPHGTIVSTRGRSKQEDYDYTARRLSTWEVPLVVLIDENSASASEIFAAAIRDHREGTLVGRRSYGKGSVQGIFPLARSGAGLRLTTAKFYSPSGQPISDVGVAPDVTVHQTAKPSNIGPPVGIAEDNALKAGINAALRKVASR